MVPNRLIPTIWSAARDCGRAAMPDRNGGINKALPEGKRPGGQGGKRRHGWYLLLRDVLEGVVTTRRRWFRIVSGSDLSIQGGGIFQNNPFIWPELAGYGSGSVEGARYLVDAYCGLGFRTVTRARFCSGRGVEICQALFYGHRPMRVSVVLVMPAF